MDTTDETVDAGQRWPVMAPEETRRLCQLAQRGDLVARNAVVVGNMRLAHAMAKRYAGRGLEYDDLVQEAALGLVRATRTWDPDRGAFSTHAQWWMRQALTRAIHDKAAAIRLPVYMGERIHRIRRAAAEIEGATGREASHRELADATGLTDLQIREALTVPAASLSLESPAHISEQGDPEFPSIGSAIADERADTEAAGIAGARGDALRRAMRAALTPRERRILELRFGLVGGEGAARTLDEIGRELGITRERVRQIEGHALAKMRAPRVLRALGGGADGASDSHDHDAA